MSKTISSIAIGTVLSFGVLTSSLAAPIFTIDPSVVGNAFQVDNELSGFAPFQTNFMAGSASSLYTFDINTGIQSGGGHLIFTGFDAIGGGTVSQKDSGLGRTYDLWAEYSIDSVLSPLSIGGFGDANSIYDIISLEYTLFAAPRANNEDSFITFTESSVNGTNDPVAPLVDTTGATVFTLGTGTLLNGIGGAGLNAQGGAYFNASVGYQNTAFGNTFFVEPTPFYDIAFAVFNNTQQGVVNGVDVNETPFLSVNSSVGGIDLNYMPVNEPSTLALLAFGLFLFAIPLVRIKK